MTKKLLIPAVVEAAATPVVVAQAADPWNAVLGLDDALVKI